jgi:putative chitinase
MTPHALAALTGRPEDELVDWAQAIDAAMQEFQIDSPNRQAAFLAQVLHESDGLRRLDENLSYSAQRLTQVWPRHFYLPPDEASGRNDARAYEHRPEPLANAIYANRLGNGPEASGDGWRFRGRGLVQLTGRRLYSEAGEGLTLDLINQPDTLLQPMAAARAAGWYWQHIDGNALADPATTQAFERLTTAINGELIGLDHREALWKQAQSLLGAMA